MLFITFQISHFFSSHSSVSERIYLRSFVFFILFWFYLFPFDISFSNHGHYISCFILAEINGFPVRAVDNVVIVCVNISWAHWYSILIACHVSLVQPEQFSVWFWSGSCRQANKRSMSKWTTAITTTDFGDRDIENKALVFVRRQLHTIWCLCECVCDSISGCKTLSFVWI